MQFIVFGKHKPNDYKSFVFEINYKIEILLEFPNTFLLIITKLTDKSMIA